MILGSAAPPASDDGGMRRRFLSRLVVVALAVVVTTGTVSCTGASDTRTPTPPGSPGSAASRLPTGTLRLLTARGAVTVRVEIAETPQTRAFGLMRRRQLAPSAGMAFLFGAPATNVFWMKDTLIPLSIAFWDRSQRIVAMLDMAPCRSRNCRLYSPGRSYIGAVEVNQGFFRRHGVKVGDRVELER